MSDEEHDLPIVSALTWIGAGLLVLAGWSKLARPATAHDALALVGIPATDARVRLLGAGETALGLVVLVLGGVTSFALGGTYAAFAVLVARRRRGAASCGCFGTEDVPVTALHTTVDGVVAVAALASGALAGPGIVTATRTAGPLVIAVVVTGVVAARLLLVDLPRLVDQMARLEEVAR